VPIYRGTVRGQARFTIAFYRDGRRQRLTFGCLNAAKDEARTAALNIQRGMSCDNDMRPQDREAFKAAQAMLADLGVPLVAAVDEYVKCRRRLGEVSLISSVEEHVRRTRSFTVGIKVGQVVDEFMAAKKQDRLCAKYLKEMERTLERFEKHLPGPIAAITTQQIDGWMRRGDFSVVTRNKWIILFKDLFNFARRQGYLPKLEPTAAESFKIGRKGDTDVGIFKPEEMEKLLRAATAEELPILAIGGFAGLRAAEIARLDWSAVDLNRKIIELRANQAKTASRRIVPISDNLAAWLAPLNRRGPVLPANTAFRKTRELAQREKIAWSHNVLRHSYISYRIASVQNAAQVALEAGNSPTIIFKHYRELVTREDADMWFGIMPTS
jgi:integrase